MSPKKSRLGSIARPSSHHPHAPGSDGDRGHDQAATPSQTGIESNAQEATPHPDGLRRYVTEQEGKLYYHVSHPIPPKPTKEEQELWNDLDLCDDLGRMLEQARALTHALHCVVYHNEQELSGNSCEDNIEPLSDLGMKICHEAGLLTGKIRDVCDKWGNRALGKEGKGGSHA